MDGFSKKNVFEHYLNHFIPLSMKGGTQIELLVSDWSFTIESNYIRDLDKFSWKLRPYIQDGVYSSDFICMQDNLQILKYKQSAGKIFNFPIFLWEGWKIKGERNSIIFK